jgi:stage II sporulation protein D
MKSRIMTIFIIIMITACSIPAEAQNAVPEYIRVGLKYGSTAPASVKVNSDAGLEFGYRVDGSFCSLYIHEGSDSVYIRKNSFFINQNGLFVEVQPGEITKSSGIAFGPYHIQISGTFADKQQAMDLLNELADTGLECYLAFDNGWRVWTGRYASIDEMDANIRELEARLGGKNPVYPVYPTGGRLQLNDQKGRILFMFEGKDVFLVSRPYAQHADAAVTGVDGRRFRGDIEYKRHQGGNITTVNNIKLQEYLYGVVPREVDPGWHIEALKAQAVAARNYAIVNIGKHGAFGFDVCTGTDCQVYGGYDFEKISCNTAVDQTEGKLIYYNGQPITAFFHASSGGRTENAENVWINIGSIQNISIDSYTPSGRSLSMTIEGSRGNTVLEKERSRAVFGYNDLKSTMFTVETDADIFVLGTIGQPVQKISGAGATAITATGKKPLADGPNVLNVFNGKEYSGISKYPTRFIFKGRGWGHGLGMSQWGAKGMAEAGYSYEQILEYYYQGAVVQ